jgi:hypothetical protein
MLCNHGARDRSHGCVFWLAVSQPLDAVASDGAARRVRLIVGLSIGVGDIDLEAGGRFALTIFYLPVLWLISAAVVGGVCVGGLAICDKRGVRASRGLAVALAGAGVIEALLFGLAVMIGHNYAARAQSLRCRAAGRFVWVRTSAHQRKTFCVKAFGSVPRPSSVPA